ncbi:MAG TPA: Ig-like domain-containing protein [Fimbriimonadaceae bacterium]|nr:Ig-like domain-containing protein [Fimbriimonadaceae bacterium]HRJ95853.1 Ig-like domain-containing protein [Fimbriimonadaceae bacterium]
MLLAGLFGTHALAQPAAPDYYVVEKERIPLRLDPSRVAFVPRAGAAYGSAKSRNGTGWFIAKREALTSQVGLDEVSPVYTNDAGDELNFATTIYTKFRRNVPREKRFAILRAVGAQIESESFAGLPDVFTMRIASRNAVDALRLANRLSERDDIEWSQPEMIQTTHLEAGYPSDPGFWQQWYLHNTGQTLDLPPGSEPRTGIADLDHNVLKAWDYTYGRATITVAVLDSGVERGHPDLNLTPQGFDTTSSPAAIIGDPRVALDNHGTAVAGCIAAKLDGVGSVGVAPRCLVIPIRVYEEIAGGSTTTSTNGIAVGVLQAVVAKARVTNSSFGTTWYDSVTADAYLQAFRKGVVNVASGGNKDGYGTLYPAAYPGVIGVGGFNAKGEIFGTHGRHIDVSAAGVNVYTTDRTGAAGYIAGNYYHIDGTSFASPIVAGVCALMLTADPALKPREVEEILFRTCRDLGIVGRDELYGWGAVDAHAALLYTMSGYRRLYCNDFEAKQWSIQPRISAHAVSPSTRAMSIGHEGPEAIPQIHAGRRNFAGEFGNTTVTVSGPTPLGCNGILLSMDILILRSMDGNQLNYSGIQVGPDYWRLKSGGATLFETTFTNHVGLGFTQSYPGPYITSNPAQHQAVERETLGFAWAAQMNSLYQFRRLLAPTPTLNLQFQGAGMQPLDDESWGLDRLEVYWLPSAGRVLSTPPGDLDGNGLVDAEDRRLVLDNMGRRRQYSIASGGNDRRARAWKAPTIETTWNLQQSAEVATVAWSEDLAMVATGSQDGRIEVRDAATGQSIRTLQGFGGVRGLSWLAHGPLVSATGLGDVTAWNPTTGAILWSTDTNPDSGGDTYGIALSPDGTRLAVTGYRMFSQPFPPDQPQEYLVLIDAMTGATTATYLGMPFMQNLRKCVFMPDGQKIVIASSNGGIRSFRPEPLIELYENTGITMLANDLAVSPNGASIALAGVDSHLRVYSTTTWAQQLDITHPNQVTGVDFTDDGLRIFTSCWDGNLRSYDQAGGLQSTLSGHTAAVLDVDCSPEVERLIGDVNDDGIVDSIDLGIIDGSIGEWLDFDDPEAHDDGYTAFSRSVLNVGAPGVLENDADPDLHPLTAIKLTNPTHGVVVLQPNGAFSYAPNDPNWIGTDSFTYKASDGVHESSPATVAIRVVRGMPSLLTGGADDLAKVWNLDLDNLHAVMSGHTGDVTSVAMSPNGLQAIVGGADGKVIRYRVGDGLLVESLDLHAGPVNAVAYSHSGGAILSSGEDQRIRLVDGGEMMGDRELIDTSAVRTLSIAPDDSIIASGNAEGLVRIWSPNDTTALRTLSGHVGAVEAVAFAPAGLTLASAGVDGTIRLWNPTSGAQIRVITAASGLTRCLAWTPDGTIVLAAGNEGVIWAWNASTGNPVGSFIGHASPVRSLTLSSDGALLASGSDDGKCFLWNSSNGSVIRSFDAHPGGVRGVVWAEVSANRPPLAAPDTYDVLTNGVLTVIAPGVLTNDLDPDPGTTLTAALVAGPSHGEVDLHADGRFVYTPAPGYEGNDSFTYRASDGELPSLPATVTILVHRENFPPALTVPGPATVDEETELQLACSATDPDAGQTLTFSLVQAPPGATIGAADGVVRWTPSEADGPSVVTIIVRVTDNGYPVLWDQKSIQVTVREVNRPPVLSLPFSSQTVDELVPLAFAATATDPDLPANALTFSLIGAPTGMAIHPTTGVVSWTPSEIQGPGEYPFQVRVTDNGTPALADTLPVTITVREVNAPPTANDQSVSTNRNVPVTIVLTGSDPDLPANTLTYSVQSNPSHGTLSGTTPNLTYTPRAGYFGPDSFTFRINDGTANSNVATVAISVLDVNHAPTLDAIPDATIDEEKLAVFKFVAHDEDKNQLKWFVIGAPAGMSINAQGELRWTPTEAQGPGTYNLTIRVVDDGRPPLSAERPFKITVREVNRSPVLELPFSSIAGNEGEIISMSSSATDPDLPANGLAFSLIGAPAGCAIHPTSGLITWTPTEAQGPGVYPVQVRVTDNGSPAMSDTKTLTITVHEVNIAPTAHPQSVTTPFGVPLAITLTGSNPDLPVQVLSFAVSTPPAHGSLSGSAPNLVYTPSVGYSGSDSFQFVVNDGIAQSAPATISISVQSPPTLLTAGDRLSRWDPVSGDLIGTFATAQYYYDALYAPIGGSMLSIGSSSSQLWDPNGVLIRTYTASTGDEGRFSPSGNHFLLRNGNTLKYYAVASTAAVWTRTVTGLADAALSPDGVTMATGDSAGNVRIVDIASGTVLRTRVVGKVASLCYSPDGSRLAISTTDSTARIFWLRVSDLQEMGSHTVHTAAGNEVEVSPDGTLVASCDASDRIVVWRPSDNTIVANFVSPGPTFGLAWSPDGSLLAASTPGTSTAVIHRRARVFRTSDWTLVRTINSSGDEGRIRSVSFHP